MNSSRIKNICLAGLFIAVVCVGTMFVSIPVATTGGYIHFGDGFIIIISVLFGKKYGAAAGGIGSAFADIFLGSAHWAVFTLIIKSFMGFAAGSIKDYSDENSSFFSIRNISSAFVCEVIMVLGYFIFGTLLKGYFMTPADGFGEMSQLEYGVTYALASAYQNLFQGVGGIIIFSVLGFALHNVKIVRFAKR